MFAFGGLAGGRPHLPAAESLTAWSCLAPALAPGNSAVAFISDHDGSPRVWIQSLQGDAETWGRRQPGPAAGPVDVSWAPTGTHLAVLVAPGGGEHTQVWTVQPPRRRPAPAVRPRPAAPPGVVRWTGRGETLLITETRPPAWPRPSSSTRSPAAARSSRPARC
ncbi:hypothetical protein GCM10020220_106990 [Nonomuraea rubra]|uniref:hypothetical protein n=1 Tax=Nonomuraea rubra TaxID=46180 RepID=UPI0031E7795B